MRTPVRDGRTYGLVSFSWDSRSVSEVPKRGECGADLGGGSGQGVVRDALQGILELI
jgi:hypothetical protein